MGPAPGQTRRDTGRGRHLQVPESERQRILRLAREAAEAELEARSSRESPRRRRAPRSAFSCARLTAAARAQAQLEYDEALRVGAAEEQRLELEARLVSQCKVVEAKAKEELAKKEAFDKAAAALHTRKQGAGLSWERGVVAAAPQG